MDWKIVLSAVLFVVVLAIALNMRKNIKRNENPPQGLFSPYKLKVEQDEDDTDEEGGEYAECEAGDEADKESD